MSLARQVVTQQTAINYSLLSELDSGSLDTLLEKTNIIDVPQGHTVITQGEIGNKMYLVLSGELEVSIILPNGDALIVNKINNGESFGEIALFDQRLRTASVKAITPCTLIEVERQQFVTFLSNHPEVTLQLLNIFSKQIRTTNDLMKESLFANISTRLAKTLNHIAHAYGRHTHNGLKIDSLFSDQELSEISGLPTEIVNSHLLDWQNKGLISFKQGYITIVNPEELDKLEGSFT